MNQPMMEKLTWQEVREKVLQVNAELVRVIDPLSPGKDFVLWKASYPFGASILKDGWLQLPMPDGRLLPINHPDMDPELREMLSYTPNMPIGVVLDKTAEVYLLTEDNAIYLRLMTPGRIFSLWGMLQYPQHVSTAGHIWQVSAGARSLTMLPKISQEGRYRKLQKTFKLQEPRPITLQDQWPLFKELAAVPGFDREWQAEFLFFPKSWIEKIVSDDPAWQAVRCYLYQTAWQDTGFLRDQWVFNYIISRSLTDQKLKPDPYLIDIVKHLYLIGGGNYPGFRVAEGDLAAPVERLQELFATVYGLKFAPTMIHTGYLDAMHSNRPLYYSLSFPTLLFFTPKLRKSSNKLNNLRDIKYIQSVIEEYIIEDQLGMAETPIYEAVTNVDYEYYHSDFDAFGEIRNTQELMALDRALQQERTQFSDKPFCHTSPFLRGCVRIAARQEKNSE